MSSNLRSANVPLDHVFAEVLAYPLASEAAFRHPDGGDLPRALWARLEQELAPSWPGIAPDELACLRDRVWFDARGSLSTGRGLAAYLRRHASGLLRSVGATAEPRPAVDGAEAETYAPISLEDEEGMVAARRRWRWVTFALPADLLLAALRDDPPPGRVVALSPLVQSALEQGGYAEPHLHVGAGLDFPGLWAASQYALAQPEAGPDLFKSPGAVFDEGKGLAGWLLRGAVARCTIAAFLAHGARRHRSLEEYLTSEAGPRVRDRHGAAGRLAFRRAVAGVCNGGPAPHKVEWPVVWRLYRELYDAYGPDPRGPEPDGPHRLDPVARILGLETAEPCPAEWHWLRLGLGRVETHRDDIGFARLFWQVLRLRNLYYRHVVQRPQIAGLRWFLRFYSRIGPGRRWLDERADRMLASALRLQGECHGLRALEARTKPQSSWTWFDDYVSQLEAVLDSARPVEPLAAPRAEVGIVLHFGKKRGGRDDAAHGRGSNADPSTASGRELPCNPTGYRYAEFYCACMRQAEAWAEFLDRCGSALRVIRGVDICSDERAVPNWVLLRPYLRVVEAGRLTSAFLGDGTPPLAHV
jgi:hypothetical protein